MISLPGGLLKIASSEYSGEDMNPKSKLNRNILGFAGLCLAASFATGCGKKKDETESTAAAKVDDTPQPSDETNKPTADLPTLVEVDPASATAASEQDIDGLALESVELDANIKTALEGGKIMAHGKEFSAETYCNEDTTLNPGELEVFSVSNNAKQLVYLCAGSLDGVENVVTVFEEGKEPVVAKVMPPDSSHRVEDDKLLATVKELLKSRK